MKKKVKVELWYQAGAADGFDRIRLLAAGNYTSVYGWGEDNIPHTCCWESHFGPTGGKLKDKVKKMKHFDKMMDYPTKAIKLGEWYE